jgi:glutathione S-transferase
VLVDGEVTIFEASSIVEYINNHHQGPGSLLPLDPDAANAMRMLDRVFDNYVMTPMSAIVMEHIRNPEAPDQARIAEARDQLRRTYAWLEGWLEFYPVGDQITLIECAAAPSLFYADWIVEIGEDCPRLAAWRAHLLRIPAVAQCVDDARPFREMFPPAAPNRD